MVFEWLLNKAGKFGAEYMGKSLLSETKKVISTFDSFTNEDKKYCAVFIWTKLIELMRVTEGKESTEELNKIYKEKIAYATQLRHLALERGGFDSNGNFWRSERNPEWASAALLESLFMAYSDAIKEEIGKTIIGLIIEWIGSVLTQNELDEIARGKS